MINDEAWSLAHISAQAACALDLLAQGKFDPDRHMSFLDAIHRLWHDLESMNMNDRILSRLFMAEVMEDVNGFQSDDLSSVRDAFFTVAEKLRDIYASNQNMEVLIELRTFSLIISRRAQLHSRRHRRMRLV